MTRAKRGFDKVLAVRTVLHYVTLCVLLLLQSCGVLFSCAHDRLDGKPGSSTREIESTPGCIIQITLGATGCSDNVTRSSEIRSDLISSCDSLVCDDSYNTFGAIDSVVVNDPNLVEEETSMT